MAPTQIGHGRTLNGVETDTHRLDQRRITGRDTLGGNHLLPRHDDVVRHRTVALHAERLVELASIHTPCQARSTRSASRIGVDRDVLTHHYRGGNTLTASDHLATNLVTGDDGQLHHRVTTQVGIQIRAAIAHITHLDEHLAHTGLRLLQLNHLHLGRGYNLYCFHGL